jgi:hydroxymethylpyrimidine/phosphomethylpyrimidine kinase
MKQTRVLTIAGSDSGGGAGIQGDLKTITVLGGFGMSVITALTAQNSLGVRGIFDVTPAFVSEQLDAVLSDMGADAAKTGMLASSAVIEIVAAKIRKYHIEKLVVDPVILSKNGMPLIRGDFRKTLITDLISAAFVVTPNIPEAEFLSDMRIASLHDMEESARIIHGFGARHVLIKGGHLAGAAVDILYDGKQMHTFSSPRIDEKNVHGTGCVFSAAIATFLAGGSNILDAVRMAKTYITDSIRCSEKIGSGTDMIIHRIPASMALDKRDTD